MLWFSFQFFCSGVDCPFLRIWQHLLLNAQQFQCPLFIHACKFINIFINLYSIQWPECFIDKLESNCNKSKKLFRPLATGALAPKITYIQFVAVQQSDTYLKVSAGSQQVWQIHSQLHRHTALMRRFRNWPIKAATENRLAWNIGFRWMIFNDLQSHQHNYAQLLRYMKINYKYDYDSSSHQTYVNLPSRMH